MIKPKILLPMVLYSAISGICYADSYPVCCPGHGSLEDNTCECWYMYGGGSPTYDQVCPGCGNSQIIQTHCDWCTDTYDCSAGDGTCIKYARTNCFPYQVNGCLHDEGTTVCDKGYYQSKVLGQGTVCEQCPGYQQFYTTPYASEATTTNYNAMNIYQCYIPAGKELCDETGCFVFTEDCKYLK